MKNFYVLFLNIFFLFNVVSFAQTGESWKLFDDSHVPRIDITVNPITLQWIYNNVYSDSEHVATFRFRNNHIDQTFDSIGLRLRGNTSRISKKKSFKVSLNSFIKGTNIVGVEKLNLNGEHNDPSIIRSKLCFDKFNNVGFTASRANHIALYINGNYYGLYINVEHIDEEFLKKNFIDDSGNLWKCLYPADLTYKGSDPSIYINLKNNGIPVYELKTNETQMDFSQLVRLITILNNLPSPAFSDSIESIFDVAGILKYYAMNILTGSWDDYWSNMNNYYLYYEPSKDIFHIIPYDYDNTLGIDWANVNWANANPYNFPKITGGSRPLAEKLISNPTYRNLYTHFIEFFRNNAIQLNLWESRLDSIKLMITPFAAQDTFRTKDYNFSMSDFSNSYSATGYSNLHVKFGIKQFINQRVSSSYSQLSYLSTAEPIAYKIDYEPKNPNPDDSIRVFVSAYSNSGLSDVSIKFKRNGSTTPENYPMLYSPIAGTKNVEEADRYIVTISPLGSGGTGKFSVFVRDVQNRSKTYPRKGEINISASISSTSGIVINEFLADNTNSIPDPEGDHDDWLELYNQSDSVIFLTGKYMTDTPNNLKKWRFTQADLFMNPNEFLIVWCDESTTQPGIHTNFKLSKGGEYLALVDTNGTTILDSITFGPQKTDTSLGRYPNASTNWMFMNPTPGSSNLVTFINETVFPTQFDLFQNYPNPFNPSTVISYQLPVISKVTLKIYDVLGKEIEMLINKEQAAGKYSAEFNGTKYSSGIYYFELRAGDFRTIKKMVIIK